MLRARHQYPLFQRLCLCPSLPRPFPFPCLPVTLLSLQPLVGSSVALQILHLASKLAASFPNTATSVARLFCSTLLKIHDQPTIAIRYTTACPVRFTKITQRIVSRWARISLRLRRIRSSLENRDDQQLQSAESRMGSSVPMP